MLCDAAYIYVQIEGQPIARCRPEQMDREHRAIVDALQRHGGETAERLLLAPLSASLERATLR